VLDPSCGNGAFLASAKDRLASTGAYGARLFGIEIQESVASECRERFANDNSIEIQNADFFDVYPRPVDAIIGNPPYIRQEHIVNKAKIRAHLGSESHEIRETSDLYVYFFTNSARWLADGGRLGFLTSERYLDTGYGAGLQHFILDHFRIHTIIGFDRNIFGDALVGTVITVLEKESRQESREQNSVRFLRIKQPVEIDAILGILREGTCVDEDIQTDAFSIVTVNQKDLGGTSKWSIFLFAPAVYVELQTRPELVELSELADIKRGITSGSNRFFYKRTDELERLENTYPGINTYFRPMLKAIGQGDYLTVEPGDTDWHVLDVHGRVDEFISEYIAREGNEKRVASRPAENPTCASRRTWFDLGTIPRGGIAFPETVWTKFICPVISAEVALDKRVYRVQVKEWAVPDQRVDREKVLAGILNADITAIFYEFAGRIYSGQAMDRASCMVYEAAAMKVIDPRSLETDALLRIQDAFDRLSAGERELVPRKTSGTIFEIASNATADERANRERYLTLRRDLNEAVLGAIGLADRLDKIRAEYQRIVDRRRARGNESNLVLIERTTASRAGAQ
jgi:adenine-specific DNA methylase